jgi:DNA polymerase (family 10)
VTASELAAAIRQLADFATIRGDSQEAAAWKSRAQALDQRGDEDISRLARQPPSDWVTGPAGSIEPTLRDLLDDPDAFVLRVTATLPWLLRRLLEFTTVDSATAAALAHHGIVTFPDFEAGLQDGRISTHLAQNEGRLRMAAGALAVDRPRVPLGRAVDLGAAFIQFLTALAPSAAHATSAGGVRRFEPLVDSLVIVAAAADPLAVIDRLSTARDVARVFHRTNRRVVVSWQQSEIDVRIAAPDEYGTTLYIATGARDHVAAMRSRQRLVRLCAREEDVYAQAGLSWVPPEMRHGSGEIEAAAAGALPALVGRQHIRGDLHMHSTYSDGGDRLADMVKACAVLGYEYIAITDHSERAGASKTVSLDALARQRDEIAGLRADYPSMAILHGIEVDIMPDGTLDFPDAVLETLDIVLASLHVRAGHSNARLTRRCLQAIAHPLVSIITHPANRMVGRDSGYDLDFPAVYAAAAETGTALEIDGAPSHLDLDGERAREAVRAGVTVTIDSDCHRARLLDKQMRLGIGTARRGWVEPHHVLNARPLAEVLAFIAAKRQTRR